MRNEDQEMLQSFVIEATEMLDEVEPYLINLQEAIQSNGRLDSEILNSIFRLFHTIKGTSGFFNLHNMQGITHEAETLLDLYRKEKMNLNAQQATLFFKTIDLLRKILAGVETSFHDKGFEPEAEELVQLFTEASSTESKAPAASPVPEDDDDDPKPVESSKRSLAIDLKDELLEPFIQEAIEILDEAEQNLMLLEENPDDEEVIQKIFRGIHTFKGNCGIFGMDDLERLSHRTETVLDFMRNGARKDYGANVRMILKLISVFQDAIVRIQQGEEGDIQGLDGMLFLLDETINELQEEVPERSLQPKMKKEAIPAEEPPQEAKKPEPAEEKPEPKKEAPAPKPEKIEPKKPEPVPKPKPNKANEIENISRTSANRKPVDPMKASVVQQSIRIDIDKVDKLVDWVGELSIAELMVTQNPILDNLEKKYLRIFDQSALNLRRIITEIQSLSLSLRMLPIAGTFKKMLRLVHDLSHKAGKRIRLVIVGEETEVDKGVIDLIGDPLVHIIRNSIDHGVETPEDRARGGKDPMGTIRLEARHESGEVWIVVKDDGRGLDRDKILSKAIEKGLVPEELSEELSDQEVYKLIFQPGFSTADKVTEISGRGVGMDVVKKNIEKIKGRIDVESVPGKSTTILLRIPLTMALIEGMQVLVGEKRYIIPLLSIREFFQPIADNITMMPDGEEVCNVRGELIPITRLHRKYHIESKFEKIEDGVLIVINFHGKAFCLFVDNIIGQMQAVIKAIPNYFGRTEGISGFTILGDGTVCPILDLASLTK